MINDKILINTRINKKNSKQSSLSKKCDCVINIDNIRTKINYNEIYTIYANIFYCQHYPILMKLYDILNNKIPENNKVIIIISGSDRTFPNSVDKRYPNSKQDELKFYYNFIKHPKIKKIYVENLDCYMADNVFPFPLGVNLNEGPINLKYFIQFQNKNFNRPLKFTNFNRSRTKKGEWELRGKVEKLCKTKQWNEFYIHTGLLPQKQFLQTMAKYTFTLIVNGGGIDPNPKIFEAIIVGTLPIMIKNEPYTTIYKDMPVIILDEEWNKNTFTRDKLEKWYNKYKYMLENIEVRKKILNKLTLDYWWDIMIK